MNQTEVSRTVYDALREEIMSLSEEECMEILRVFFPSANPVRDIRN
jgi:hypothetical protein